MTKRIIIKSIISFMILLLVSIIIVRAYEKINNSESNSIVSKKSFLSSENNVNTLDSISQNQDSQEDFNNESNTQDQNIENYQSSSEFPPGSDMNNNEPFQNSNSLNNNLSSNDVGVTQPPSLPNIPDSTPPSNSLPPSNPSQLKNLTVKINGQVITDSPISIVSKVVASEISPSFHKEAIKAQAVSTHSYIRYNNDNGVIPSVGSRNPDSKIYDAVASVINRLAYYNNSVANTVYHATSSGKTNSSKDVWGGNIPYLISVPSKYDDGNIFSGAKNWGVKVTIPKTKVKSLVKSSTGIILIDGDENNWFKTKDYTSGGYNNNMTIAGQSSYNGKSITGRALREQILVDNTWYLKSAKFNVSYTPSDVIFTTYGYGHGVGLSQDGANGYATYENYTYDKILYHYFKGITIK